MSKMRSEKVFNVGFSNKDRRDFIKYTATMGAFTVPFVTSFMPHRGLKFGVNQASAQYGGGNIFDRFRERQEAFRERIRERQESIEDRVRERQEAVEEAAERLRTLLDRLGHQPPQE